MAETQQPAPSTRIGRITTGLLLAAVLVPALFLLDSLWIVVVTLTICAGATFELGSMFERLAPGASFRGLLVLQPALALWLVLAPDRGPTLAAAFLFATLVLSSLAIVASRPPIGVAALALGLWTMAIVYLTVPVLGVYELHRRDPWLLFLVVLLVGVGDTVAFYVGSSFGRHRMAPRLSPKKTWEGAVAGVLGALVCGAVFSLVRVGRLDLLLLALVAAAAVAGQVGDLFESMIKRGAGVKDSGSLLPGHGGVLDRFDAFLFAVPVFHLGCQWLPADRWIG